MDSRVLTPSDATRVILRVGGEVKAAKLGLLSYIMAGYDPAGRDVVFVPVGLAYDRVLEDKVLLAAAVSGERRFGVNPLRVLVKAVVAVLRRDGWPVVHATWMAADADAQQSLFEAQEKTSNVKIVPR